MGTEGETAKIKTTVGSRGEDKNNGVGNAQKDITGVGIPFEHIDLTVHEIPPITVPQFGVGAGEGDSGEEGGEKEKEGEEIPDDISLESFKSIMQSGINVPALYFGPWWLRTPEQCDIFSTELYYYCQKKGINLRDYLFDELPLLLAGIQLAGGIYNSYKEQKPKKEIDVDKERLEGEKEEKEDGEGE